MEMIKKTIAYLSSVRLTIITLICIAASSVIGTIIPQHLTAEAYAKIYSGTMEKLILGLQLNDLYHAWWFLIIAAVFTLNLVSCMLKRTPSLIRALRKKQSDISPDALSRLPVTASLNTAGTLDRKRETLYRLIKEGFGRPNERKEGKGLLFSAEKGRIARWGFLVTHLGILLIIIGAFAGSYGYRGQMELLEGEQSRQVYLGENIPPVELDFGILCDTFTVSFYPQSRRPSSYESVLTIIEDGRESGPFHISVNNPLTHRGVTIYQSSYGTIPDMEQIYLKLPSPGSTKPDRQVKTALDTLYTAEDGSYSLTVTRLISDFAMDEQGHVFSRSQELRNPAVQVAFSAGDSGWTQWLFARYPDFHSSTDSPVPAQFLGVAGNNFTGLQITRSPGLSLVWVGCILLVAGAFLIMFMSHQQVWVRVTPAGNHLEIAVAGKGSRPFAFKQAFGRLVKKLKTL